jgi:serine/threonine-protein kinase RsbT
LNYLLRNENLGPGQGGRVSRIRSTSKARAVGPIPVPNRVPQPSSNNQDESGGMLRIPIQSSQDILEARKRGRELAAELRFSSIDRTLIATAISELARNIVLYAGQGEIHLSRDERLGSTGIVIIASDRGPGIRDMRNALQEGHSASRGLGLGLPGVKRIMDEFDIQSTPRQGTTVTVKKWKAN